MIVGLALSAVFYVFGPTLGALLASAGVTGPIARLILGVGPSVLKAGINALPSGPLTPRQQEIVERDRARSRQELFGPFG